MKPTDFEMTIGNDADLESPRVLDPHADGVNLVGKILEDRYEIESIIGEGGMGVVYCGRQLRLKRPVAIKIPRSHYLADEEFMERFEQEAVTMARCLHENIVTIYDVHAAKNKNQISYIAMELVHGTELEKFLMAEQENLTVRAVVGILMQLARGIDAAHNAGVVHRDIKPSNMIVTMPQRVAKIMDFGVARYAESNTMHVTGTPAYIAPEQVQCKPVGPHTDIYAFGVTIYKLMARALPFAGESQNPLLCARLNGEPTPLRAHNPRWPSALDLVLRHAMRINPEKRQPTATRLVEQVEKALAPCANRSLSSFFEGSTPTTRIEIKAIEKKPAPLNSGLGYLVGGVLLLLFIAGALIGILAGGNDEASAGETAAVTGTEGDGGSGQGRPEGGDGRSPATNDRGMDPVPPVDPDPVRDPEPEPPVIDPIAEPPVDPPVDPDPIESPDPFLAQLEVIDLGDGDYMEDAPVTLVPDPEVVSPTPEPEPEPVDPDPEPADETPTGPVDPTPEPVEVPPADPEPIPAPDPPEAPDYGPLLGEAATRVEKKIILDHLVYEQIRRPIFRGHLDEARKAFHRVDPDDVERFFELLEAVGEDYKGVKLRYEATAETIHARRAEIEIRFGIRGKPKVGGGRAPKERTVVSEFTTVLHFEKEEGEWHLLGWPVDEFLTRAAKD